MYGPAVPSVLMDALSLLSRGLLLLAAGTFDGYRGALRCDERRGEERAAGLLEDDHQVDPAQAPTAACSNARTRPSLPWSIGGAAKSAAIARSTARRSPGNSPRRWR